MLSEPTCSMKLRDEVGSGREYSVLEEGPGRGEVRAWRER